MTRDCTDVAALRAVIPYVAGTLAPGETEVFEAHLIECERCQEAVRLATTIRAEVAQLPAASPRTSRSRVLAIAGGVVTAAAAIALVVAGPGRMAPGTDEHRAATEYQGMPAPLFPIDRVRNVERLEWTGWPGARSYRVSLVDTDGELIWDALTEDTTVELPPAVRLESGQTYFWKVEAQTALDRWTGSDFIRFELQPSPDVNPRR